MQTMRTARCIELRDVVFGPAAPAHLVVRGIRPARDTLGLVAVIDGSQASADIIPAGDGTLFVQGSGDTPLRIDPYDRALYLRGVKPSQTIEVIRLYVTDGRREPRPVDELGIESVSPS